MKRLILTSALITLGLSILQAQIPIETVFGDKQATFDLMFFKYFKTRDAQNSKLLFFNRNIASFEYRRDSQRSLSFFSFTEAISYNDPNLKGFAPVLVMQFTNRGVYPKAGAQYVYIKRSLTIFSWLVSETMSQPEIDYYLLLRFTPKLSQKLNLYTQTESLNVFNTQNIVGNRHYQRFRIGIGLQNWQFGLAANLSIIDYSVSADVQTNVGGFLRHEFL